MLFFDNNYVVGHICKFATPFRRNVYGTGDNVSTLIHLDLVVRRTNENHRLDWEQTSVALLRGKHVKIDDLYTVRVVGSSACMSGIHCRLN